MNGRWVLALLFFLATCSLSAFAGSPTIGVLDPTCPDQTPDANLYFYPPVSGSSVMFNTFGSINGGGVFAFCNPAKSQTWDTVDFVTSNFKSYGPGQWRFDATSDGSGSPILCDAGTPFLSCTVTITVDKILMEFSDQGSNNANGIQANHWMTITLNDTYNPDPNSDNGAWTNPDGSPVLFAGGANVNPDLLTPPVPEPTSLALLGTGLTGLLLRRRKSKRS